MTTDTGEKLTAFRKALLLAGTCHDALARQLAGEDVPIPAFCQAFTAGFKPGGNFAFAVTVEKVAIAAPGRSVSVLDPPFGADSCFRHSKSRPFGRLLRW